MNTTRKLLAAGIALAAAIGTIAVASDADSATSYLLVSLSADGTGASAVWDSAGNPDLTLGSSLSEDEAVINSAEDSAAPAEAPTFTTDNYADGSPLWVLQFLGGDQLEGYPSQAGLGTSNWTVITVPRAVACTVANRPVDVTYAAALTFLQNSVCGGDVVSRAAIIAEGQSPGTSDDLSGISYNGLTLAPGPDVVTVTSPGQQTGTRGTSITPLTIYASSNKGDGVNLTATGLPPGLSITGGGVISGSPTATGSYTATVNATDNGGTTGSATFGWTVSQPPAVTYGGTIRLYKMGLCLDDRNNNSSNGAVVQVWRCNGLPSQQWQVMSDGTIRHDALCLDASGFGTANGTKAQLWACTGSGNQQWDTKNFRIHYDNPAATGKVLDDTGYGGNGTRQQIWTDNGTVNQLWETF